MAQLKTEMMELIEYIEKLSIRFEFYPENIGLSDDMSLKYFIGEFDPFEQAPEGYYNSIKACVEYYFSTFETLEKPENRLKIELQKRYLSQK